MSKTFTVSSLRGYDGRDGTIYVAVNGRVFDVTENGKELYGEGGPYTQLAGRDASRALVMVSMDVLKDTYDDISDLSDAQKQSLEQWVKKFVAKYPEVGKLVA